MTLSYQHSTRADNCRLTFTILMLTLKTANLHAAEKAAIALASHTDPWYVISVTDSQSPCRHYHYRCPQDTQHVTHRSRHSHCVDAGTKTENASVRTLIPQPPPQVADRMTVHDAISPYHLDRGTASLPYDILDTVY